MKNSVKWIAILCLIAMLLQACGSKKNDPASSGATDPASKPSESVTTPPDDGPKTESVTLTEEELYDKIAGGWIGQMVGVAWAASTEFCYAGKLMPVANMPKWDPNMINNAFDQDDLYVEIPFLDAMKEYGVDCDPKYMAEKFRDSTLDILLQRIAIKRNFQANGNSFVPTFITLFQKPGIYFLLFFFTARRLFSATHSGVFTASFPQSPCPLICSLISLRVGIAPGKIAVTLYPFLRTSSLNAIEKEVSAPLVALYTAKYGIG